MQGGVEVLSENFRKFAPKYVIMDRFNWEDIKQKFKSDKRFKLFTYIGGGAIVLVALYLGYRQLIWTPADEKANDGWWTALNYVEKDSTDQAIKVLIPFVKKYDGHVGGEIGQYLLGTQYMKKGQFQKALSYFEKSYAVDPNNVMTNRFIDMTWNNLVNQVMGTQVLQRAE